MESEKRTNLGPLLVIKRLSERVVSGFPSSEDICESFVVDCLHILVSTVAPDARPLAAGCHQLL